MTTVSREIREAREARSELGIAPDAGIADILEAIEDGAGIPVTVAELPSDFAGVMRRDPARVDIFINGTDAPVRQRFTLAHEFGHYRLGHATVYDTLADLFNGHDPQEVQANAFAGEFLLPRAGLDAWMERAGDPVMELGVVVRLARHFGVSADVARIRLENTGRLRGRGRTTVLNAIRAGEHKSLAYMLSLGEHHDSLSAITALPRLPRIAQQRIKTAYAAGLTTIEDVAVRTGQDANRVAADLADVAVAEPDPDF